MRTINLQTPATVQAAAAFAEAVTLTRTLGRSRKADQRALRKALRSTWDYCQHYPATRSAFGLLLKKKALEWVERESLR
jgi:hypothetical protein